MVGEIQTSFIPKTPISTPASRPIKEKSVGLVTVVTLILALTSVAVWTGAFLYKNILTIGIASAKKSLELVKQDMPLANLARIDDLNSRLNQAETLLDRHVSSSQVFNLLQAMTIPQVRFTSFTFSGSEVRVKGLARGYEDIAAQAKVFKTNQSRIANFTFSDFDLDQSGRVVFNLALTIAPNELRYAAGASIPASTNSPAATTTP